MRAWLWLSTGMVTREWVAVHRYHHKHNDTELDPHSPVNHGWLKILFYGAFLYVAEKKKPEVLKEIEGDKTLPHDFLEKYIFGGKFSFMGIIIMLGINMFLFGPLYGSVIWLVQMIWIPFWAAGVINGLSHTFGYTNFHIKNSSEEEMVKIGKSKNILPLGLIIGGEELHNNHHKNQGSAKFSKKWFEFDMGWGIIKFLEILKLAKVKSV